MSFTFTQPTTDLTEPAPAASILSAVNYDRSPSLVELSAAPNTPIEPHEFTSFAEAAAAFSSWLPTCNWGKPPTLKRFWYESEKHLTPGVDFVSWGFREHLHWIAANNGEIVERTEDNEELASLGPAIVRPAVAPEAAAALERSAKIAEMGATAHGSMVGFAVSELTKSIPELVAECQPTTEPTDEVMIESGVCHCGEEMADHNITSGHSPVDMNIPLSMASPIQILAHNKMNGTNFPVPESFFDDQPGEGTVDQSVAESVASSAVIAVTKEQPADTAAVPTIRLKYTEAEYAELRRLAEENYAIELQRKENQYAEISMERARQEDKVKALKAEEKGQLESLRFFKSEGPKYPKNPEIKQAGNSSNQEGGSSDLDGSSQPVTSDHDVTDERFDRYKALPLMPIVKDIQGLGPTKLETLTSSYPTVGKLLDLQQEKGLQWYKSVGKGFGPELGSRIEEAVADALTKVE